MTQEEFRILTQNPVLLDGATGSNLMKAGMPRGVSPELWNLENPQILSKLQEEYVQSGSQIVYAPTFTASAPYLADHGLEDRLEELNRELVALSRKAAKGAYVAGDLTTLGKPDISYETLLEVYGRQAKALADAGVDLFIIETMMGEEETMAAAEACKMAAELPVMCSFSVTADGMLYFGGSVYDAAPDLEAFGADAVGINCSCGPDQMVSVVRNLAEVLTVPIIAKPNAGMPSIDEKGNAVYSMDAKEFGIHMKAIREAGATLLGGCCGTDPSYIRAVRENLYGA